MNIPDAAQAKEPMPTGTMVTIVLTCVFIGGILIVGGVVLTMRSCSTSPFGNMRQHSQQVISTNNLQQIYFSIQSYEIANGTRPPESTWIADLISQNHAWDQSVFDAPVHPAPSTSYFLVPDGTIDARTGNPSDVLAYEHPDLFTAGGSILYTNGSALFVYEPQFSDSIANLQTPGGAKYEPHASVVMP